MPAMRDIIPDIHADIARLDATLSRLGEDAPLGFLGDLIDAGTRTRQPDDAAVLTKVRRLCDDGRAVTVMGNHELNAILFHTLGVDGMPMRSHSGKTKAQHRSFVRQFGVATPEALEWVGWFLTLPLWRDLGGLRMVHACWSQPDIDLISQRRPDGRLQRSDLAEVAAEKTDFARAVKNLVSGPELRLPGGRSFHDTGGHQRHRVRLAWWRENARSWRDAALSVPDTSELPAGLVPTSREVAFYDADTPVLMGHYKMTGPPGIETPKAACLDYPATPCTYRWRGESDLDPERLTVIG